MKHVAGFTRYGCRGDGEVVGVHGAVLAGGSDKDGYRRFTLIDDQGVRRYVRRAALICEAFHGPRPAGLEVRHRDGNRTNDAPTNLAWSNHPDNCADKEGHGTWQIGERNGHHRLTLAEVTYIREHPEATYKALAERFDVSTGAIYGVRKRLTWRWAA